MSVPTSILVLGRQPEIGRAELESVFGAEHVQPLGEHAMECDLPAVDVPFNRLGGSTRLARPLLTLDTVKWPDVVAQLKRALPGLLDPLPLEGKIKLGLSAIDLKTSPRQLLATGLELKKICRTAGRSARIVPNDDLELSTAQVLHNGLLGELGLEILLIAAGRRTVVAQTVAIQDIDAYAARDQGRPKRDARVGMLPPKLAQIIVNLGVGQRAASDDTVILDPFCGTGVVLQEALLMGYGAYGTDLESRMIDFTRANLEWLATHNARAPHQTTPLLEVGDATSHAWVQPFQAVASEVYLGRPLTAWPPEGTLQDIVTTCNTILQKFLQNLTAQTKPGLRLCLAVPAWRNPNGRTSHLPLLDHLEQMGYNQVSFEHVEAQKLVYSRPNQIVARQLLVITRK